MLIDDCLNKINLFLLDVITREHVHRMDLEI